MPIHRTHVVPTGEGTAITRRFPLTPKLERTVTSGHDGFACQRVLAGDSLNDEQWGNDLCNPWLHQAPRPKVAIVRKAQTWTSQRMGENRSMTWFPEPASPMYSTEVTANMAEDSMSMVAMVL